jgi:hypothetical protein
VCTHTGSIHSHDAQVGVARSAPRLACSLPWTLLLLLSTQLLLLLLLVQWWRQQLVVLLLAGAWAE